MFGKRPDELPDREEMECVKWLDVNDQFLTSSQSKRDPHIECACKIWIS